MKITLELQIFTINLFTNFYFFTKIFYRIILRSLIQLQNSNKNQYTLTKPSNLNKIQTIVFHSYNVAEALQWSDWGKIMQVENG